MTSRPTVWAGRGRRPGRPGLIASTVLALLCLGAQLTPSTSAGYLARVINTANTAGTAPYFTCTGATGADTAGAVFAYRLNEPAGSSSAADFSGQNATGTYRGSMNTDTSLPKACPRDSGGSYLLNGTSSYLSTPNRQNPPERLHRRSLVQNHHTRREASGIWKLQNGNLQHL